MIEKQIDIKTSDGVADAELFYPDEKGTWPGIIMYPDIGGIAAGLPRHGAAPCLRRVRRSGPQPVLSGFARAGVSRSVPIRRGEDHRADGEVRKFVTPAGTERDAKAFVGFLSGLKQIVGKIGTVGYCMGGGMAMRTAAAEPDKVAAAASFHGSQLASAEPDSPHTLAPRIKAQMYFGFAIEDRTMPPEAVEKLKSALDAAGVKYEGELYAGARHGWCVKDHNVYHEHQAEHAWHHLIGFFNETLK